jgi:hypothetical protein
MFEAKKARPPGKPEKLVTPIQNLSSFGQSEARVRKSVPRETPMGV